MTGTLEQPLLSPRFPRASAYHPAWVTSAVSGGANPLCLTEWLTEAMALRSGMRVLDLGCGRGASSVFLHREFRVEVWATDMWFSAADRLERFRDAEVEDAVFPIQADARALPFAPEFFDAIVAIDSFPYYGTDHMYLPSLLRFLKPGGEIGIAGAGLVREFDDVPEHLREWWTADLWSLHSASWWRSHWERSGIVDIDTADTMPDGWRFWLEWQNAVAPTNAPEITALETDSGRYLGYSRVVAHRRSDVSIPEPITSVAVEYRRHPLLRTRSE
jgi:SAM-dependent methyltransferase